MTERLTDAELFHYQHAGKPAERNMARELLERRRATPADDLRAQNALASALPAEGDDIDRMRVMLWASPEGRTLINKGDAKLYWLNEGDVTTAVIGAALAQKDRADD